MQEELLSISRISYSVEPCYTLSFQVSKILEFLHSIPLDKTLTDDTDKEMIEVEPTEGSKTDG
jgi:hypothetical protein